MTIPAALNPHADIPVVLIDLSAIFRAAWHANADGALSVAFRATLDGVRRCANFLPGALVAVCCDGRGNWRKEVYPEYKAQREVQPEAMYSEFDRVKARLESDGYLLWTADGFEADDVIATAADAARMANHGRILICSHDKDLLQLIEPGVTMLRTSTWVEMDEAAVVAKFGVAPHKLGAWLALVGDKSDNIPGAPGIGDVKATALVQRFESVAGILQATGDELMKVKVGTKSLGPVAAASVLDNAAQIQLALKLVTLRFDAPIKFEDIYSARDVKPLSKEPIGSMDNDDDIDEAPQISRPKNVLNQAGISTAHKGLLATDAGPAEPPMMFAPEMYKAFNVDIGQAADVPIKTADTQIRSEDTAKSAMVVMAPGEYERQLEPRSPDAALKMATMLFDSRLYQRFGSREAICAVIIRGREMGLGALTALDVFHVIEGKPAPHAHLIVSIAENHADCEYFMMLHSDDQYAEYETKNRKHPRPTVHRYSIEDAVAAGLATLVPVPRDMTKTPDGKFVKDGRGQWDKRRKEMIRKTCAVQLARIAYPSAALGLYSVEELGGE